MSIVIADANESHVPGIHAIETECFSEPWPEQVILSQLPDDTHVFLTALEDGQVVGYVNMMYVIDEGYIGNVAVAGCARRRGIADRLIDALQEKAEALQLAFMTLEVRESNVPAIGLYAKHGFRQVGVRKNYYTKPKENAVLMTVYLKEDTI